jgi:UDP-glucuronate 4-epimerase
MRILITGSSGQIGTNLALRLLDAGHAVFGVDRRLNTWTNRVTTLLQDLAAPYRDFAGGIGGVPYPRCDLVVHLAANAKVHELVQHPHRAMENIASTFNVLEYCRHNRLPIISSSSREVYGDIHHYITEEQQADFSFTESPYSASKIAGEALIYSYARCYGLRYLVFRFSNVYGRYDNDIERMERVLPLFIRAMSRGEPVTVYGYEKILDFTYVDDCVAGVMAGIERLLGGQIANQTINLAYGQGNSLVHMAELVAAALGVEPNIRVEPSKRVGEVTRYVADIRRAQELLDYQPGVSLEEGIRRAVAWSREWEHTADRAGK